MASLQDAAVKRVDMYQFDPNKIEVEPGYNIRTFDSSNDEEDAVLKESIRVSGVRTPLTIRSKKDQVFVVAGHRRLAAVKELIAEGVEIKAIPCLPEAKNTTEEDRVLDLLRSNQAKPLTAMQRAEVFKRLMAFGWDEAEIATKVGCSRSQVTNMLMLASAERDVRQMVQSGEIAATTAIQAIKQRGDEAGTVLSEAVANAKAEGKKKVSATKALTSKPPQSGASVDTEEDAPVAVTITHAPDVSSYTTLRREANDYIAALEEIMRLGDKVSQGIAEKALGWSAERAA